jgi:hypothetical protein
MRKLFAFALIAIAMFAPVRSSDGQTGAHRKIFSPSFACGAASIPTTNLQLWLRADCFSYPSANPANGTTISNGSSWKDMSPAARSVTVGATSTGTYQTGVINGQPAVFTLSQLIVTVSSAITQTSAVTMLADLENNANNAEMELDACGTSSGCISYVLCHVDGASRREQGAAVARVLYMGDGTAVCDTSWHQMNFVYASSNVTFRLDRAADTTLSATSGTLTTSINALFNVNGGNPFRGKIAELIYYSTNLSSTDITTVETYLHNKYGL